MTENIIENTQQEIITTTSEITEAIEHAVPDIHTHHGPFYLEAEFWVAAAFVLVIALLCKPVGKLLKILIIKRIEGIKNRINDAITLKEDAQKLLAEYERKLSNANNEAKEIIIKAENEIEFIRKESLSKMEKEMRAKEKDAESRILSSQNKAQEEIVGLTSHLTINALKLAIQKRLDSKNQDQMIDDSINLIAKL